MSVIYRYTNHGNKTKTNDYKLCHRSFEEYLDLFLEGGFHKLNEYKHNIYIYKTLQKNCKNGTIPVQGKTTITCISAHLRRAT